VAGLSQPCTSNASATTESIGLSDNPAVENGVAAAPRSEIRRILDQMVATRSEALRDNLGGPQTAVGRGPAGAIAERRAILRPVRSEVVLARVGLADGSRSICWETALPVSSLWCQRRQRASSLLLLAVSWPSRVVTGLGARADPASFVAFDLLAVAGHDVRRLPPPLRDRHHDPERLRDRPRPLPSRKRHNRNDTVSTIQGQGPSAASTRFTAWSVLSNESGVA
jgi:hypothetical protein